MCSYIVEPAASRSPSSIAATAARCSAPARPAVHRRPGPADRSAVRLAHRPAGRASRDGAGKRAWLERLGVAVNWPMSGEPAKWIHRSVSDSGAPDPW
jgi:hypothetical protein